MRSGVVNRGDERRARVWGTRSASVVLDIAGVVRFLREVRDDAQAPRSARVVPTFHREGRARTRGEAIDCARAVRTLEQRASAGAKRGARQVTGPPLGALELRAGTGAERQALDEARPLV